MVESSVRLQTVEEDGDVRRVLAALRADGRLTLDDVPWRRFQHAYGPADDVPALLRGLAHPDAWRAARHLDELWSKVRHQGGSEPPAALAVPFLIAAAADPATHGRDRVLLLAAEAGRRSHDGGDRRAGLLRAAEPSIDVGDCPRTSTVRAAREAVAADAGTLVALLADRDPAVRATAAYALAAACSPPSWVRPALRTRLATEAEPPVRISLILALTQLGVEHDEPDTAARAERFWRDAARPPDVRLAGALAWLCASPDPAPPALLDVLAAIPPEAEQWLSRVPWPDDIPRRGGLAAWLVAFLGDDAPDTQLLLAERLAAAPDPAVAASALHAAHELARTWRTHSGAAVDLLSRHLEHPEREVARTAARHLASAGEVPPPIADRVAASLAHPDPEVHAWAAVTLAHRGDPRSVAPLAALLRREDWPWPEPYRRGTYIAPPEALLDRLHPFAAALLPAVLHRLATPDRAGWQHVRRDLLAGLAEWPATDLLTGPPPADPRTGPADPHSSAAEQTTTSLHGGPAAPPADLRSGPVEQTTASIRARPAAAPTAGLLDGPAEQTTTGLHGGPAVQTTAGLRSGPAEQPTGATDTLLALLPQSAGVPRIPRQRGAAGQAHAGSAGARSTVAHLGGIVTVLGRIGPAAAAAVPVLDRLTADAAPADLAALVWARWRITGDRADATAATLAELATGHGERSPSWDRDRADALRRLADLGPAAAAQEPTLRALTTSGSPWVRAHAAYALWRATGDAPAAVTVLVELLAARPDPARFDPVDAVVAAHLAEVGPPGETWALATAAVDGLVAFVGAGRRSSADIRRDQRYQAVARAALRRVRAGLDAGVH
ncbi:HEAT repeat domain-containing protein [Dactylosporangium sp. NPDC005572]|uniref:HEAT repeat domain-containing protein n=1 Tax=Dactylosporangium sp. NPDC005572 TaxID=3156889 RepID=UPI0033BA504A